MLGVTLAAAVTVGLVKPVRRLLAGTAAVENGAFDTVVPVTSRDEIGRLTHSFNTMVGELRVKQQIRETFGKYVDPRIVEGLIDRPELTDQKGARREMTILFCDMQGFTSFSEGMTPIGLVNVLNRYLTVISDPVRRNDGIIDKYIGDAVMAFWGEPFTAAEDQARLACAAALEQLAALPEFESELPDLIGVRRGLPRSTSGSASRPAKSWSAISGPEQTRSYTVIGDTVNFASRLEGAGKTYGTRVLVSEATQRLAAGAVEMREIELGAGRRQDRAGAHFRTARGARAKYRPTGSNCATPSSPHSPPIAARHGTRPRAGSAPAWRSKPTTSRARSFSPALRNSANSRRPRTGRVYGQ